MRRLLIASLILAAPIVNLSETTASTAESTESRIMHFYASPSRTEFDLIQQGIKSKLSQYESQSNGAATLTAVFLARVHEKYQWSLIDLGQLDDQAKSIIARDRTSLSSYVNDDSRVDPEKLDIWWSGFFATGDRLSSGGISR